MKGTTWLVVYAVGFVAVCWSGISWSGAHAQDPSQFPINNRRTGPLIGDTESSSFGIQQVAGELRSGGLIALASDSAEGQQVTVIDSQTRVMSVYHIDSSTGSIKLKSVRSIGADLMMDEFNTAGPFPREIRAMLKHR